MTTIYEQLGGAAAMDAAVDLYLPKGPSDDRVSEFFDGVDMERQDAKQKAFMTMVTANTPETPHGGRGGVGSGHAGEPENAPREPGAESHGLP